MRLADLFPTSLVRIPLDFFDSVGLVRPLLCREGFDNFDLHLAQIPLTGCALAFPLVWVIVLRRPWRAAFQTTVVVVGHERALLGLLR